LLTYLSVRHRINVIGGTHVTRVASDAIRNVAYAALGDGTLHRPENVHAAPSERTFRRVTGGSEFPEQVCHLVDQGAMILFGPFCTDDRNGYLRGRYCCAARAIENQIYATMSGVCGKLPNVDNMDVHYAQGAVLTPCDLPFAWNRIEAEAEPNAETMMVADVSLAGLAEFRLRGTVQNLSDRRTDLHGSGRKG